MREGVHFVYYIAKQLAMHKLCEERSSTRDLESYPFVMRFLTFSFHNNHGLSNDDLDLPGLFSIKISRDDLVCDFNDAIIAKNPNDFPGISAHKLSLWKWNRREDKISDPDLDDQKQGTHPTRFSGKELPTQSSYISSSKLPVSGSRVSFSNYAYLLTVLSSLKPLPLVSETRVSFSNQ